MHAVRSSPSWIAIGAAATALALLPGIAAAEPDPEGNGGSRGSTNATGSRDGYNLKSLITFSGSTGGSTGKSGNGFTPAGNWTPPACWYEPRSPAEFQKYVEGFYESTVNYPGQHSYAKTAVGQFRNMYKDGEYKNYNLDKADEGAFWVAVQDKNRWDEPGAWTCSKLPFWVKNGNPPNVENAITPDILAQLAYNQINVPETSVTLAPENNTKVSLATWAWLDSATFKPISVTASLKVAGVNISATTTATPRSLSLKPGTKDATLHPGSGECTIQNGRIGAPYTKGNADKTPPCGLTYLRSSGNGTYQLQATLTWKVTWTGTGTPGGKLPDGTFGTTQNITVQEIQAINR
ncbi:hypothetical protein OG369_20980 [Streptomyces sp. NBC_01221]|uniref:hypothetical protein n=1 Tax=Streptomyces sp. NBC_01221 TaxID=2903782 RepID=UPI0022503707|nr:hypothetical protein [Streptomyces sp. NBC_01221]MCX4788553.1 hypothetical protein [Streptomyces sp. NBC_01221]